MGAAARVAKSGTALLDTSAPLKKFLGFSVIGIVWPPKANVVCQRGLGKTSFGGTMRTNACPQALPLTATIVDPSVTRYPKNRVIGVEATALKAMRCLP